VSAETAPKARKAKKSKTEKRKSLFVLNEAQAALTWGVILALAALVGGIYLYQASTIATIGRQVQLHRNELNEMKRENSEFERDIAEAQSLERMQEKALLLGYIRAKPENVEYLVIPDYPALNSTTPTPEVALSAEVPDTIGDALWLSFQDNFSELFRGESP